MLGIASLSALGPFGAAVEITVILYPCVTLLMCVYYDGFVASSVRYTFSDIFISYVVSCVMLFQDCSITSSVKRLKCEFKSQYTTALILCLKQHLAMPGIVCSSVCHFVTNSE